MQQEKIERINELARKARKSELSEDEKEEQTQLRYEYVQDNKNMLIAHLNNTYIIDSQGKKRPIKRRGKR
jgi:uncharacterized protein YnzC (UPF0291/DUF896 family)